MGFSIQLHIVKDQQLVPGRAKGLIENLEEWERDSLLQIGAKALCTGSRPGVGLSLAALVGCCTLFWTSEAWGISQGTLLGGKKQQQASGHKLFPVSTRLAKAWQPSAQEGKTQETLQWAPVSPNQVGESWPWGHGRAVCWCGGHVVKVFLGKGVLETVKPHCCGCFPTPGPHNEPNP